MTRRAKLPTNTVEPMAGVQLKDGRFTFPPHLKCRVDTKALNEIPRNLDICQQGIEALNDLFYEVPPEKKEGVLTQKALWENVRERLLDMRAFNATSSYTNLSNQLLPLQVILPEERQYFSIDLAFTREDNNPFKETKRFARELLDIVAAIKVLREEKLFGYQDFYIFPSRLAFTITDSETGDRFLTIGIHSIAPEDQVEGASTEQLSIRAIRDLIHQRWDRRAFRKVLKANSLNDILIQLQYLAQDVPTWKRITYGGVYVGALAAMIFIVFSFLMFLSGLTPWNKPVLQEIALYELSEDGLSSTQVLPTSATIRAGKSITISEIRLVFEANRRGQDDKKGPKMQVIGTYQAPMRLEGMGFGTLDQIYQLHYKAPIKIADLVQDPKPALVKFETNIDDFTFRLVGQNNFGRERFTITPTLTGEGDRKTKGPSLNIEALVEKPNWTLEMNPKALPFQQAEAGMKSISTDPINIYANPTDKEKEAGEKVDEANLKSYFTVSFDKPGEKQGVPLEIHYLDPKGTTVAGLIFKEFDEGRLKSAPALWAMRAVEPRPEEEGFKPEDEETRTEEGEAQEPPPTKERPKDLDILWLKRNDILAQLAHQSGFIGGEDLAKYIKLWRNIPGKDMEEVLLENGVKSDKLDVLKQKILKGEGLPAAITVVQDIYYRLNKIPKEVNAVKIIIKSKDLPSDEVSGFLHMAVAGVNRPLRVPITFHPKQQVEFTPNQMVHTRDQVTGLAYPISLQKRVWGEAKTFNLHELRYFTFHIQQKGELQHLPKFGAWGLGLQLRSDPNTLYFYNTETGETCTITEYSRKGGGEIHFAAKPETYGKSQTDFFESLDQQNLKIFGIREAIAKTTSQLFIMILTDKNVEDAELTLKWRSGDLAATLPISARSREALRIVQWQPETIAKDITRYTRKDWIEKVAVTGPLGSAQYQAIVFSGEQPDKDVSSDMFVNIANPELVSILYQTVDGDWFSNVPQSISGIKVLHTPASQLKTQKFGKEKDQRDYFRVETQEIGKIKKYLIVPGPQVKPGQKETNTKIYFYYPTKDMEMSLDVTVACEAAPKVDWQAIVEPVSNTLKVQVTNYPRSDAKKLARTLHFLSTCTSVYLLHNQYHNEGKACDEDKKLAETIRWSLESIGFRMPQTPPASLGQLGETIKLAIDSSNEEAIKKAYEITREALLLSWSPQAQALLLHHLELGNIINILEQGQSFKGSNYTLDIKLQPPRESPILVAEPERFAEVVLSIPFDKLLLDKKTEYIVQLHEAYYYNIPQKFEAAPEITNILREIYPYPDAFPKQDNTLESNIQMSKLFYDNVLKYSLWEQRVNEFRKPASKFWIAMLAVTKEIAGVDGKIDTQEVNRIAKDIQLYLRNYFITPVDIRRVYWPELKDKVRGMKEVNRDIVGLQEKSGLVRFVERTMMSQSTELKCWYNSFTFVVDNLMIDRIPFHRSVYIKTIRPSTEGYEAEEVKMYIFKREGMRLVPFPGNDYNVEIWQEPDTGYTHYITVQGITAFQNWFDLHTSSETKGSKVDKRLQVRFFYEEQGSEYELARPGDIRPPIIDFEAHPASILLFEVSGYRVSPDAFRQLARGKTFVIQTSKGKTRWNWEYSFDNGPILVPFSFSIKSWPVVIPYTPYTLTWKQEPAPAEEKRTLEALTDAYDMDVLYINTQAQLPISHFFPYNKLEDICTEFDMSRMSSNRMIDFLEKLFEHSDQIPKTIKFKWNKELAEYYKKDIVDTQMFRYSYSNGHQFKVTVPGVFEKPADYKGKEHPELKTSAGQKMTVIWRIMPKDPKAIQRGFPKYILQKDLFKNSDPVFSKE